MLLLTPEETVLLCFFLLAQLSSPPSCLVLFTTSPKTTSYLPRSRTPHLPGRAEPLQLALRWPWPLRVRHRQLPRRRRRLPRRHARPPRRRRAGPHAGMHVNNVVLSVIYQISSRTSLSYYLPTNLLSIASRRPAPLPRTTPPASATAAPRSPTAPSPSPSRPPAPRAPPRRIGARDAGRITHTRHRRAHAGSTDIELKTRHENSMKSRWGPPRPYWRTSSPVCSAGPGRALGSRALGREAPFPEPLPDAGF